MELKEYFSVLCRETAVNLKIDSPSFKLLTSGKKKAQTGIVASFKQDKFIFNIHYIESGKAAYAQQTIWISFVIDREPLMTFSIYDILTAVHPENLKCYTYTYVDSQELMRNCFKEIKELLTTLLPEVEQLCEDGVKKNALIALQKEKLNQYFGENFIENSEMVNDKMRKIISMMLFNFFQYQIESAVVGGQALFHQGKEEKALKHLKKAKYRSIYEDIILLHLEKGGKAPAPSETVKQASTSKGTERHGGGAKGGFKLFLKAFLFSIPALIACVILFLGLVFATSHNALFIYGIKENLIFLFFPPMLIGLVIALNLLSRNNKKDKKITKTTIQKPPLPQYAKTTLKYFTIAVETIALILIWASVNSTASFYKTGFSYSTEDIPLSKTFCEYSSIDYVAVVDGYYYDNEFQKDSHIVFVTKSGEKLDLYNSTFFSTEKFEKELTPFLKENGIETKHLKSIE